MSFDRKPRWNTARIKAGGQRVAEVGFGKVGEIRTVRVADLQSVAVTGMGAEPRVLDGFGRVGLEPGEDVVLRLRSEDADRWWFVPADAMRDAFDRAQSERRSIELGNAAHVSATPLPRRARDRDAMLAKLRTSR